MGSIDTKTAQSRHSDTQALRDAVVDAAKAHRQAFISGGFDSVPAARVAMHAVVDALIAAETPPDPKVAALKAMEDVVAYSAAYFDARGYDVTAARLRDTFQSLKAAL